MKLQAASPAFQSGSGAAPLSRRPAASTAWKPSCAMSAARAGQARSPRWLLDLLFRLMESSGRRRAPAQRQPAGRRCARRAGATVRARAAGSGGGGGDGPLTVQRQRQGRSCGLLPTQRSGASRLGGLQQLGQGRRRLQSPSHCCWAACKCSSNLRSRAQVLGDWQTAPRASPGSRTCRPPGQCPVRAPARSVGLIAHARNPTIVHIVTAARRGHERRGLAGAGCRRLVAACNARNVAQHTLQHW